MPFNQLFILRRFLFLLLAAISLPSAVNAEDAFSTVQCENKNYSLGKLVNLIKSSTVTLSTSDTYDNRERSKLGIVIGKNDKYTYIVSDSSYYRNRGTWKAI